jgi:uncharacterized DUF497 family protein
MAPPPIFRRVYRTFERIGYDPRKSDDILAERGFDLAFIATMFPGVVLEREDTRGYNETRYQAIGELLGNIYVVVYTRQGRACRLITAWDAEPSDIRAWNEHR